MSFFLCYRHGLWYLPSKFMYMYSLFCQAVSYNGFTCATKSATLHRKNMTIYPPARHQNYLHHSDSSWNSATNSNCVNSFSSGTCSLGSPPIAPDIYDLEVK